MTFSLMKIARLGFEPKLSESESLVLPLHYQAGSTPTGDRRRKYTVSSAFAKVDFLFFSGRERFLPRKIRASALLRRGRISFAAVAALRSCDFTVIQTCGYRDQAGGRLAKEC